MHGHTWRPQRSIKNSNLMLQTWDLMVRKEEKDKEQRHVTYFFYSPSLPSPLSPLQVMDTTPSHHQNKHTPTSSSSQCSPTPLKLLSCSSPIASFTKPSTSTLPPLFLFCFYFISNFNFNLFYINECYQGIFHEYKNQEHIYFTSCVGLVLLFSLRLPHHRPLPPHHQLQSHLPSPSLFF